MKLTDANVDGSKLPERKSEMLVFDECCRASASGLRAGGKRTWIVQYRIGSKQRRLTLGTVKTFDVDRSPEQREGGPLPRFSLVRTPKPRKSMHVAPKAREMTLAMSSKGICLTQSES